LIGYCLVQMGTNGMKCIQEQIKKEKQS
jgi:hypothetical protein